MLFSSIRYLCLSDIHSDTLLISSSNKEFVVSAIAFTCLPLHALLRLQKATLAKFTPFREGGILTDRLKQDYKGQTISS